MLHTDSLSDSVVRKVKQRLFHLSRLREFKVSPQMLRNFYSCTRGLHLDGKHEHGTEIAPNKTTRPWKEWLIQLSVQKSVLYSVWKTSIPESLRIPFTRIKAFSPCYDKHYPKVIHFWQFICPFCKLWGSDFMFDVSLKRLTDHI